jgi:putative DNA primase/helicase
MIKETTGLIAPIAENIPEELTERPQWVCWRYEERDGKPTKVPFTPYTPIRASSTDPMD